MIDDFQYLRGNKLLLPYVPVVDYKEDVLVDIWKRFRQEDLVGVLFHDEPEKDLNSFISYFSSGKPAVCFVCEIRDGLEYPAGMAWLSDITISNNKIKRAQGSFCFFTEYQKPEWTNGFGELILDFWFSKLGLDVVMGMTPSLNRPALSYIKRLGFIEMGRIPSFTFLLGSPCSGVITYMTSDGFKERYQNGKR